jgi:peroxiredoxin
MVKTGSVRNFILVGLAMAIVVALWMRDATPATVPEVALTTIEGEKLTPSALRGKVVLVNFWATDCAVCVKEMPAMADTYRKYQARGFEALFVAMPHDRPDHVVAFTQRNRLPFKVALDVRGEINRAFGSIEATPTTFIADKRGRIVKRILGEPDFARLHVLIERALAD